MAGLTKRLLINALMAWVFLCLSELAVADNAMPRSRLSDVRSTISSNTDTAVDPRPHKAPLQQMRKAGGAVRSFRVPRGVLHPPKEFWNVFGKALGLGPDDRMAPLPSPPALQSIGRCQTQRFRQYHRDVALLNGFYNLVICHGSVVAGLGLIHPALTLDTVPKLSPKAVRKAATRAVLRGHRGAETKATAPVRLLIHVPEGKRADAPHLVYRLQMALNDPPATFEVLIDARTGALVRKQSQLRRAWAEITASGESEYDHNVTFFAEQSDSGAIRLKTEGPIDIQTRDANNGSTLANSTDIIINSPTVKEELKKHGISAHWAAQQAWQYFADRFGWNGLDGTGKQLRVYLNLQYPGNPPLKPWGPTDAGWFGPDPFVSNNQWQMIALGGGGTTPEGYEYRPMVHPEILAHEMTHAIQYHSIGVHQGFNKSTTVAPDPGGLSESFADIFAVLAESQIRQASVDYYIGNQWNLNRKRLLNNPAQSIPPQPAVYQDSDWLAGLAKPVPHFFAGPHSRWFYLLAEGDPPSIIGIGTDKAGEIFFRAMTQLLFPSAEYLDALEAEKFAAEVLYGEHTVPVVSLLDAAFAAGVGPGYVNTLIYEPADQATDVEPWPVELAWQVLADEVQWQIEISTSPQFSGDVITRESDILPDGTLVQMVSLPINKRPNLHGGTQYFWRVRGRAAGAVTWQDWRLPVSFHAAKKNVIPITPWGEDKAAYHPWELPFSWHPVYLAERYELQVYHGPHISPANWHAPLLTPKLVSDTTITLDVRVEDEHTWRIRAIGPDSAIGPTYGVWTEVPFTTLLPKVTLLEPLNGDPRYPWPTRLRWESVKGAYRYLLDLTDCDGVFKSANPQSPLPCPKPNPYLNYHPLELKPEITNYDLNVKPEWLHDKVYYWWQARVIGPAPWHDEGGLPTEDGHWVVDGADTLPEQIYPGLSISNTECIDLGKNIKFVWGSVLGALGYHLSITELRSGTGPPSNQNSFSVSLQRGPKIFAQTYGAQAGGTQSQTVINAGTGPMAGQRHLGYWWHIESLGPDGHSGLRDIGGVFYYIEADTPTPHMLDGHQFGEDEAVVLPWQSDHSPFADYLLRVYQGEGCLDVNLYHQNLIHDTSPGKSSAKVTGNMLKDGNIFSWSVTPAWHLNHSQCHQGQLESDCVWFKAPNPVCGNGDKEDGEQCDDGNLQDGDGCSSQCKVVLACGQQHGSAGGIAHPQDNQPLDLGGNQGTVWITAETYTIPDRLIFRHGNDIIHEIDCYGTNGTEVFSHYINGGSPTLLVTVEPGCDDNVQSLNTKWAYTISCVDDSAPLPDHTPE